MAEPMPLEDPVATEFVEYVLDHWGGELGFAPGCLQALGASEFDIVDLLNVVLNGVTTALEKESAHDTIFERFGRVDDGSRVSVTLSFCPNQHCLTVVRFSKP